jgi:hypothetical protein
MAQKWLNAVVLNGSWTPVLIDSAAPPTPAIEPPSRAWNDLIAAVSLMHPDEFAPFDHSFVHKWAPRVMRFTF